MSNPKRRRKSPTKRAKRASAPAAKVRYVTRHRNPAKRATRRRRNPIGLNSNGKPLSLFTPALVGALGATAVNTLFNTVGSSLPASLTGSPNMVLVTRAGLSLALAMVAPHAGRHRAAVLQAAEGSLTVVLHDAIVSLSGGMGMALGGMGNMGVYMPGRNAQTPSPSGRPVQLNGMNAYLTGSGSPQAAQMAARQRAMAAAPKRMAGFGF